MNVDPLRRRVVNVLLGEARHQILADDGVEGPALVRAGHLLPHGRQEALRVEEASDPEHLMGKEEESVNSPFDLFQRQNLESVCVI